MISFIGFIAGVSWIMDMISFIGFIAGVSWIMDMISSYRFYSWGRHIGPTFGLNSKKINMRIIHYVNQNV